MNYLKILVGLCITISSINSFASCSITNYHRAIFDDGKNGNDTHLQDNLCYDGNSIKSKNGENSVFGNGGKGGDIIIPPKTIVFMPKDKKLKPGNGGESTFGDGGNGGNIYNE